ncbi:hypothetical protein K440DRAFT_393231 [Wilcoxina mikolae CBS 423.85]|nr:hypothetical protein K440DRAFT_393231 [Wilcoxina mikolae CBS 423.85]
MSSVVLGRLFNRLASTSKLQLIAARTVSLRTSFRPDKFGPSSLTACRTAATAAAKATTATKAKPTRSAAATKKTTTTKKAAATKKPAAKTKKVAVKKKAAPKKKAAAKKKAAPKKKKPAARKPRTLTDAQKEAKKAKVKEEKLKLTKQEMIKNALKPPYKKPELNISSYSVFLSQNMTGKNTKDNKEAGFTREISKAWVTFPDAEKQKLKDIAQVKKDEARAAYRAFIESHTPDEIYKANSARRWLKARKVRGASTEPLVDHRLPKHPTTAFFHYMNSLRESGEMKGNVREESRAAGQKWKALSDEEKKPYLDLAEVSKQRYATEKAALLKA